MQGAQNPIERLVTIGRQWRECHIRNAACIESVAVTECHGLVDESRAWRPLHAVKHSASRAELVPRAVASSARCNFACKHAFL